MTTEAAAHRLIDYGYRPVILQPMSKRPLKARWQEIEETHDSIRHALRSLPHANIGIHTGQSKVAVADCDAPEAEQWVRENLNFSPMTQRTPSGNLHVFFRDFGDVPNKIRFLGLALDIRAKLSQVVVAPSRDARGEWVMDNLTRPDMLPELHLDEWLPQEQQHILPESGLGIAVERYINHVAPAISGQGGHNQTFGLACRLIELYGLNLDQLLLALRHFNQKCSPPWSDDELIHKATDAIKKVRRT